MQDFGITTLIAIIVNVILYCSMIYAVIDKCCDTIDILPAKVLTWVSLRGQSDHSDFDKHMTGVGAVIKNDARAGMAKSAGGASSGDGGKSTRADVTGGAAASAAKNK